MVAAERALISEFEPAHQNGYGTRPHRLGDAGPDLVGLGHPDSIDLARAEQAVADLLSALGADLASGEMARTPARVAAAYAEMLEPPVFELTTFPNDEGVDELIVTRDIPFRSICSHHLLPFLGMAHVGYLPGTRLVGLSKMARVVSYYAAGFQVQERLTAQVADCLAYRLDAKGVGVVLEAEHTCMTVRGASATGARTVTSALRGQVREDPRTRGEFIALVGGDRRC